MKKGIHPEYYDDAVVTCPASGTKFTVGSTKKEIQVEICSDNHPFYTGKQRFAERGGNIEKFNKKYKRD